MEPTEDPTIDAARVRRRMAYRLWTAPLVSVPLVLGAGLLLIAFLSGSLTGYLGLVGATGLVFALGTAAFRGLFRRDRLAAESYEALKTEAERNHTLYLHYLWRRLRLDRDPRTKQCLDQIRGLYQRMQRAGVLGNQVDSRLLPEIREKTEQLYRSCLAALERTHDYWKAAREMGTEEGRGEASAAREALLDEVGRSIDRLNATLDHLQAVALRREDPAEQLASVRAELDEGLEVAKRVDERMKELDQSLQGYRHLQ